MVEFAEVALGASVMENVEDDVEVADETASVVDDVEVLVSLVVVLESCEVDDFDVLWA